MAVPPPRPDRPTRRRRTPRFATPILLVLALLAGVVGVLAWLDSSREAPSRRAAPPGFDVPELDVRPGTVVPHQAAPGSADTGWMRRVADKTDIPERMLRAYVAAETETLIRTPDCRLTWATLAGIGRTESSHGRFRGAVIGPDGRLSPPVIGVPLDGSPGVRAIRDTDGGRLDGDVQWDRAVGAMQFLPVTWSRWSARANGDGADPDPQNVDDAALSAARYLCASGGDLGSPNGWWRAVFTYNRSTAYGQTVFSAADAYSRAATA